MSDDNDQDDLLDTEKDIVAQVKKHREEAGRALGTWRDEARDCYAFVAGDQWNPEDKARLEEMLRTPVVFNRIGPMVDSVSGSEINNRQQVQYIPRQVGDSGVNELLSGAADYFRQNCDADDEESDAFLDAVTCGVGCTETFLDYVDDPEGMVKIERRDPMSMRWDPSAKKRNLTDKKWAQKEEWPLRKEVQDRWPDKADEIAAAFDCSSPSGDIDEPVDQQLAWLYASQNKSGYDKTSGRVMVLHEQWLEMETYWRLLDPATGQVVEMEAEQYEVLSERVAELGIKLDAVKRQRKVWKQAFVCGDILLETGDMPCNECSWKFITGKRDRNTNTWYGIVRPMLDPQRWANKFFSQLLHIINTNAKGGLLVEKGATDNPRKLKEEWSRSDSVTTVNDGALSAGKIQPKPVPQVPPQINQMLQFSISSIRDVSGINLELLGMADRDQPGVLEAQRKQSALTVLAAMFDGLKRYRKEQGRLLAAFIQEYLSDGRLVRIAGGNGLERYIPLLRDPQLVSYDVVVDDMPNTTNQKERTFAILMQLLPNLAQMGVPFAPDLLEYTPLPTAMTEKWRQLLQQQQQQPKPPNPDQVKAQASLISAQANATKAQGQIAKDQAEAQQSPMEMQIRMRELAVQDRELSVRAIEAEAARARAIADVEQANMNRLGLIPPSGNGSGSAMPRG